MKKQRLIGLARAINSVSGRADAELIYELSPLGEEIAVHFVSPRRVLLEDENANMRFVFLKEEFVELLKSSLDAMG